MAADHFNLISARLTLAQSPAAGSPSAIAFWVAVALVTAGIAVIILVGVFSFKARVSGPKEDEDARPASSGAASMTDEAQALLRLMGEAEDLCARLGSELDSKADRIERLLARAEGRLGGSEPPAARTSAVHTHAQRPAALRPSFEPPAPPVQVDHGQRPEIVTRPIGVPAVGAGSPARAPTASQAGANGGLDPLASQVYQLADTGLSASDIAQSLGQHTGKVELILALRRS
jgi:hypothetical protein